MLLCGATAGLLASRDSWLRDLAHFLTVPTSTTTETTEPHSRTTVNLFHFHVMECTVEYRLDYALHIAAPAGGLCVVKCVCIVCVGHCGCPWWLCCGWKSLHCQLVWSRTPLSSPSGECDAALGYILDRASYLVVLCARM